VIFDYKDKIYFETPLFLTQDYSKRKRFLV
jgi:hypothetical protein